MKDQLYILSFTLIILIISSGIFSEINAQNINNMEITSISLEHTNPSMGPYEEVITITLMNSKEHSTKIDNFINKSQVNNTTSLYNFINASINKETKLLEKAYKNAPQTRLNEGESISNLTFSFENGKKVILSDVYRRYNLTNFNPDFTKHMVKHGYKTQQSPTELNELKLKAPIKLDNTLDLFKYTDKTLIIKLQLTPGMPNSDSYQLLVYGNGDFKFKNGFFNINKYSRYKAEGKFSKNEIETILSKAEDIDFIGLTSSSKIAAHVDDGQQTILGIWQEGYLRTGTFGYGESAMNKETKALADYILSLVEN